MARPKKASTRKKVAKAQHMKRTKNTNVGNKGVNAIRAYCDDRPLIFQAEPREDYGVDCYIEVCEKEPDADGDMRPLNFVVALQSKAGASYGTSPKETPNVTRVYVDQKHIDYWTISNVPVIFTYLDEKNQLYWKHVQRYFQESSAGNHIDFADADKADDSLADYLWTLQGQTPNVSHRLKIVRAKEPMLTVNGHKICLSKEGLQSLQALSPLDIKKKE